MNAIKDVSDVNIIRNVDPKRTETTDLHHEGDALQSASGEPQEHTLGSTSEAVDAETIEPAAPEPAEAALAPIQSQSKSKKRKSKRKKRAATIPLDAAAVLPSEPSTSQTVPLEHESREEEEANEPVTDRKTKSTTLAEIDDYKLRHRAAELFRCSVKHSAPFFVASDPFNPGVSFGGFKCTRDGLMGGSLLITEVNGRRVPPQLIYGVPKLQYPYSDNKQNRFKNHFDANAKSYFFSTKWNGTNVQFFKYVDERRALRISAKTKASASLSDCGYGDFLTATKQVLGFNDASPSMVKKPPALLASWIADDALQGFSCELCGNDLPHLVKYDFDIDLKPLFYISNNGKIKPVMDLPSDSSTTEITDIADGRQHFIGPRQYSYQRLVDDCRELQERCLEANQQFRTKNRLKHRYEYNHFITEGYVMYLLDGDGWVVPSRTMYKAKPRDVEEVHWEQFDVSHEGRVRDAVIKCITRDKPVNADSLRAELDIGPKEWGKFGGMIMRYVRRHEAAIRSEAIKRRTQHRTASTKASTSSREIVASTSSPQ